MSRLNKVNKGNYTQAGRLTPDEAARERGKQAQPPMGAPKERVIARTPKEPERGAEPASSDRQSEPEE